MNQERSQLHRGSFANSAGYVLVGSALVALGVYLGWKGYSGAGGGYWFGALVAAVIGAITITACTVGEATCPGCGATHLAITEGEFEKCDTCEKYLQGNADAIWLVEDGHVAEDPSFGIELDGESRWPQGCCVCGGESTRTVEVTYENSQTGRNLALAAVSLAGGGLVVRTGGGSSASVEVPHCEEHDDGAKWHKDGQLLLRSYAFQRSFVDLNLRESA